MPDDPFDWNEYLALAELLLQHITAEYSFRTAIVRAYYAAYWSARLTADPNGDIVPERGSHIIVCRAFDIIIGGTGHGATIGKQLKRLKAAREAADYMSLPRVDRANAEKAIVQAKRILEHIRSLLMMTSTN